MFKPTELRHADFKSCLIGGYSILNIAASTMNSVDMDASRGL